METRRVWPEPAFREDDKHYYFKRLLIQAPQQIPHVTIVNVGDKVIVKANNTEYIAEVVEFYECKTSRRMMYAANWFYLPRDLTKDQPVDSPVRSYANHEVIYSSHSDRNNVASISDLCYVVFVSVRQPLPHIEEDQTNLFFCRYFLNAKHVPKRVEELRKNKLIDELETFHQKFPLHIKQYLKKDREFWDGHLQHIHKNLINDLSQETLNLFYGNDDQKPSVPPIPYSVSSSGASNNYHFPSSGGSYYYQNPVPPSSLPIEAPTNSNSYFQSHSSPLIQQQQRETTTVSRKSKSPINPFLLPTLTTANGVVPQLLPPLPKPAVTSKGPSLSFKKLDFSKTDEELACELYQRYQMQLHPLIPVDLKAAREFFSKNPTSLDSYVKKIKAVRRRKYLEAQKKLNPPSNSLLSTSSSAGNQQNINNNNNNNYADEDDGDERLYFSSNDNITSNRNRTNNNNPSVSFQQQAQDSDNQQLQQQKVRNTKKRSRSSLLASEDEAANKADLPLTTETQQQQPLGSWFSESDDDLLPGQTSNRPQELSGSSSASFLNKKLKRKKREKVKIVEELMKQIIHEQEQQIQTERILNSDESDDDDDPGYYSEDLATIPDIIINHEEQPDEYENLLEHNRLKEEAKKNRLHWEKVEDEENRHNPQMISDAKLSAYYLQAHEEYLRIKLQFLMNLSNQLMHGSRISRNSLKTKNRNSTSTTSFSPARKRFKGGGGGDDNNSDDDEDEENTVQWPNNNSNNSSNKEKSKKKMNIYGEYEPIVDGSIVVFRGDLQEIFLNVLCER
jgi:hypothetical protein